MDTHPRRIDTHLHPFLVDIVDMSIRPCLVDMSLRLDTYVRPFHMSVPPFLIGWNANVRPIHMSVPPFLVDTIVRLVNMSAPPFLNDTIQCERRPPFIPLSWPRPNQSINPCPKLID